ncbi:ribonuclease D [Aliterella atlantica]|uniref:3'-5' exonuclease n=1 Tax=Aliterella atlantica CENA595 TaxID=1618023 RepID=A0A0D8ZQB1_9CYAN|nr:3'-5' exonuclease [Aliterella atlantica]KJH70537.1 3'-5' exonuclease [Aliterella atlantica CENA595]
MRYFADSNYIISLIEKYTRSPILWLDTEVADFTTRNPKLSLIQVLDTGEQPETNVVILDVLHQPEVVDIFIESIMLNPAIEKVFHNAKYDLKFLGKTKAKNVTCTLEMAKKIPYYLLPLPNLSLKTLAESLCNIAKVDKTQQASDWGQRPLNENQLNYAKLDPVYLYMVHQKLLHLQASTNPNPVDEDITLLTEHYLKLKQQLQIVESELSHVEARIKAAMQAQNIVETSEIKLSSVSRTTLKVAFNQLAEVIQANSIQLDLPITLTQKLQKDLAEILEQLPVQEEVTNSWRLTVKQEEVEE